VYVLNQKTLLIHKTQEHNRSTFLKFERLPESFILIANSHVTAELPLKIPPGCAHGSHVVEDPLEDPLRVKL
jgi:hypothetical protein